ncbi:hypothetical protein [Brevundimonas goettingensis]|nr:hypothetical protein [Brevundimonas goettingensis]
MRRAAILAGSVALHALVLGLIGLGLLETRRDKTVVDDRAVYVELEPRPLLQGETARIPRSAQARPADAPPLTRSLSRLFVPPRLKDEDEDRPSPPSTRAAGVPAAGAPAPPAEATPWTYRPESLGAAVGRTMRTGAGGCRIMDGHLSPTEQAICDERFNEGAAEAGRRHPPGGRTLTPSEQRREARFAAEGRRALEQYEGRRAPLRPGGGNVSSGDCPGGNLGIGCAGANLDPSMREGATSTIRQGSNRTPGDQHRPLPGHEPN